MDKGIYTMLAEAQSEMMMPTLNREGQIGHQRYKYVTLDSVLNVVRPPLNTRGIFLTQATEHDDNGWHVTTAVCWGEDGRLVLDTEPYEYDRDPKEYGKRVTYAKRTSLCKAFGIVGEEDTNGDVSRSQQPRPQAQAQAPRQQARDDQGQPSAEAKAKADLIRKLKQQCVKSGVRQEGIDEWYRSRFGSVPPARLDDSQMNEAIAYLGQMVKDARGIK